MILYNCLRSLCQIIPVLGIYCCVKKGHFPPLLQSFQIHSVVLIHVESSYHHKLLPRCCYFFLALDTNFPEKQSHICVHYWKGGPWASSISITLDDLLKLRFF